MLRVVTLPITPGNKRSFLTLFTPFVADMYAKSVGAELTVMLNTVGIKSANSGVDSRQQHANYQMHLKRLGMGSVQCVHDGVQEYETMFQENISRMRKQTLFNNTAKEISWCSCGRVEIPTEVVRKIILEQRHKTLITGSSFSTASCSTCHSPLETATETVQTLQFPQIEVTVEPRLYTNEIRAIADRTAENNIIVSRYHRNSDERFDADFRWYGYIGYVANPGDEVTIISSPTTLNQAVKVMAFNQLISPEIKVKLLIHPLVRVVDDQIQMSTMDINGYFDFLDNPLQARMFFALGLQWSSGESLVRAREVHLIKLTSPYLSRNVSSGLLFSVLKFNRNNVSGLYKQLRRGKSLTTEQTAIAWCIQPPT